MKKRMYVKSKPCNKSVSVNIKTIRSSEYVQFKHHGYSWMTVNYISNCPTCEAELRIYSHELTKEQQKTAKQQSSSCIIL